MVTARPAPAPAAVAQLDLPAGLRLVRDVPAYDQTHAVMDLARMQFIRAPVSDAGRDDRRQRPAEAWPAQILLVQQRPLTRARRLRHRRAGSPVNQHFA